jgi:hypothetical protein
MRELIKRVFARKKVPLTLLGKIADFREYHRTDYARVQDTVKPGQELREFDFYFDYVLRICEDLEALWNE